MLNVVIFGLLGFVVVSAAIVLLSLSSRDAACPANSGASLLGAGHPIPYVSVNGVRLATLRPSKALRWYSTR